MTAVWRLLVCLLLAALALQLFFVLRIALMAWVDPASTSFQRSQAWRIGTAQGALPWRQQWVPYGEISDHLKRAVLASEDDSFSQHSGVDWDALRKAWQKNEKAQAQVARRIEAASNVPARSAAKPAAAIKPPKIVGGSTVTQQLAKNLLLSGERTLLRKGQELVLTVTLEALLPKQRILEIYLNSVEWGEGVFGAEAAAQHYFRKSAAQLGAQEAARLAVMLPAPKRFEKLPRSPYLAARTQVIAARLADVQLP
ncbi:MAG: transglycosylase domain-containing protein [Burkholderiaceae bacterium]